VATRILAHRGLLAPDGRVAALVGSEVVYVAGRGVSTATMTPYDVCALRLADGAVLAGTPPDDAVAYLQALRRAPARAVARTAAEFTTAPDVASLVAGLCRSSWDEAEGEARAAGALMGAYLAETELG
jgi:hypothetical protein